MPQLRTDIVNCARCGGRHNNLKLKQFTNPVYADDGETVLYTHYGDCPKMGQPILVLVEVDENAD